MTDRRQELGNTFIYLIPLLVGAFVPFIGLPVFTRILSVTDYGNLALAQTFAILIGGIANFGMVTAVERNFFQYRENRQRQAQLLYSSQLFITINYVLVLFVTWFFQEQIARDVFRTDIGGAIFFWALLIQFFSGVSANYLIFFRCMEKAGSYAFYMSLQSIIGLLISLLFVVWLELGVIGLVWGQVASLGSVSVALWWQFSRNFPSTLNRRVFTEALMIGMPLVPKVIVGYFNTQFDRYLISLLSTLGNVGLYEIGQRISYGVFMGMTALQNVYSPGIYKNMFSPQSNSDNVIALYLNPYAYISFGLALLVAIFSEEVLWILVDKSYFGAIDIVTLLAFYYGLGFFNKVAGNQFAYSRKTYLSTVLSAFSALLHIGLSIVLIGHYGLMGAAWAALLAGIIFYITTFFVGQHCYKIEWDYRRIYFMVILLGTGSIGLIVMRYFDLNYWARVVFKVAILFVYLLLGKKIGLVTMKNLLIFLDLFSTGFQRIRKVFSTMTILQTFKK